LFEDPKLLVVLWLTLVVVFTMLQLAAGQSSAQPVNSVSTTHIGTANSKFSISRSNLPVH
jgi:hypothetical protein